MAALPNNLRNIAIVAHVDHGKTTLVDHMLRQSGTFRANEVVAERAMDSNDLERERGITILAKNTSLVWHGTKINIVDTPGHSDFGGEVERTLMMADGALLLVDAAEGPLPQTRFVLSKCLERGFPIIVVINKIDRADARPEEVLNEVFDLFIDLEASEEQAMFQVVYAVGKLGLAKKNMADEAKNLDPLFEAIVATVPPPKGDADAPLQVILCNTTHDDYVGKLLVGRVVHGRIRVTEEVAIIGEEGKISKGTVKQLFLFEGLKRVAKDSAEAGDVVAIAGIDQATIGDTIADKLSPVALPRIVVEEPTIKIRIGVNTSPFAGKSKLSKYLTSRHVKERLEKESLRNLAIRVEMTESPDTFLVLGRGELQLAILVETMRREGYETQLGNPEVVTKMVKGELCEPIERVTADVPMEYVGVVTERLGTRRGRMEKMTHSGGRVRLEFVVPSRGLIGFRGDFLTATRGTGLLNTLFEGWLPWGGTMIRRTNGAIVADRTGVTTPYALHHLQARGNFFLQPGAAVYEGMIIGEHNRPNDTDVNAVREKKLTNVRNHGKDENVMLAVPKVLTIENAMEWIDADELVEVTPDAIRVRKRVLAGNIRGRRADAIEDAQGTAS
jgi:GTP-binding protein